MVKAADALVDFRKYDNNHDCVVDLVMVVHQGAAQEETGNPENLFSIQGTLNKAQLLGDGTGEVLTNDPCHSEQFMTINTYALQPEVSNSAKNIQWTKIMQFDNIGRVNEYEI